MLTKFSVTNFKNFSQKFVFDLSNIKGYNFNVNSIKSNIVNNAIIYGHNGVGKSNLGFAIFDIIKNLTDNESNMTFYNNYLNAFNNSEDALFEYEFLINSSVVVYKYTKSDHVTLISEELIIDNNVVASIDRKVKANAFIKLEGAENLKTEIPEKLSVLKYIRNNTVLDDVKENIIFSEFFLFVEKMLFFRSLRKNSYIGIKAETKGIQEDIISRENVKNFELFLNNSGVECVVDTIEESGNKKLAFDFNGVKLPFFEVASQGTIALAVFYFWLQRIKEDKSVSFLFIDEFDAYYHHKLSKSIVEELKNTGIQFILTTHNPTIMNNYLLRPDCYFIMNNNVIKSLSSSTDRDLREAHNLEKLYKSSSFNV